MSKVKLLLDVVSDMRSLADSIQSVADSIAGNTPEPQSADSMPEKHTLPPVSIDQVRAVLAEKSGGKTAEVKALVYKYDAGKLSGVKPEDYAVLLEEARKL